MLINITAFLYEFQLHCKGTNQLCALIKCSLACNKHLWIINVHTLLSIPLPSSNTSFKFLCGPTDYLGYRLSSPLLHSAHTVAPHESVLKCIQNCCHPSFIDKYLFTAIGLFLCKQIIIPTNRLINQVYGQCRYIQMGIEAHVGSARAGGCGWVELEWHTCTGTDCRWNTFHLLLKRTRYVANPLHVFSLAIACLFGTSPDIKVDCINGWAYLMLCTYFFWDVCGAERRCTWVR